MKLQKWSSHLESIGQHLRQSRVLFRFSKARRLKEKWIAAPKPRLIGKRTCLLDIQQIVFDGEQGRRFHSLVSLLTRSGYDVYLVPRLGFLQSAHKGMKWSAVCNTHVYDPKTAPVEFDLCLSDRKRPLGKARRTLRVRHHLSGKPIDGEVAMPYGMFPAVWDLGEDKRFESYRDKKRPWRLFFGGNCSRKSYEAIHNYPWLSPVNRFELIGMTLDHFSGNCEQIENADQLDAIGGQRHEGFVLLDNDRYRLPAERWMSTLADADFFLAAPGTTYPLSHNCVEALAVGTIPVLEYGSLFDPHLENGVNCVAFSGRDGFRRALTEVEQMSETEISRLRQGAIDYYERHLSPEAFSRLLNQKTTSSVQFFAYHQRQAA